MELSRYAIEAKRKFNGSRLYLDFREDEGKYFQSKTKMFQGRRYIFLSKCKILFEKYL